MTASDESQWAEALETGADSHRDEGRTRRSSPWPFGIVAGLTWLAIVGFTYWIAKQPSAVPVPPAPFQAWTFYTFIDGKPHHPGLVRLEGALNSQTKVGDVVLVYGDDGRLTWISGSIDTATSKDLKVTQMLFSFEVPSDGR